MVSNGFIAKLWNWFDSYFLFAATLFLIAFIPLYPKIPIADLLPGYIVRIRFEDFFVAAFFGWWLISILRRKIHWQTPITWWVLAYVVAGALSNLLGMFLINTIPTTMMHVGKSFLHWARYIEYFSLFFIAYAAIEKRWQAVTAVVTLLFTSFGIVIYGYGQKYFYWPVYSTMNREFSKGIRLYLDQYARAQSTFAGHYDLGAYLALVLPIFLALYFFLARPGTTQSWVNERLRPWLRRLLFIGWFAGLWLLVLSATRASFGAYLVGVLLVLLFVRKHRSWWWFLTRGFLIGVISVVMMFVIGDLTTRFLQLIDQQKHPQIHWAFHTANDIFKDPEKILGFKLPERKPPEGAKPAPNLEEDLNKVGMTVSDTQPTPEKPTEKPQDVYVDVPDQQFNVGDPKATLAGELVEKDGKLIKERTYSDCAIERSLSLCIRLETLWPRAVQGFLRNPVTGSGYATLTKESVGQFTEADSTDNNFLRVLGETGAVGFFFFYGTMAVLLWYNYQTIQRAKDVFLIALASGVFAGTVGLLVNAMYIDVFAASKVAYSLWTLQGIAVAIAVKEGVVGEQFAFARQAVKSDVSQLSALLAQVEAKASNREQASQGYLSVTKKRTKSTKRKKSARRR